MPKESPVPSVLLFSADVLRTVDQTLFHSEISLQLGSSPVQFCAHLVSSVISSTGSGQFPANLLVAKDGSILVSAHQIKSYKIKDIPVNIIVLAKTSQLSETVSKGLEGIRIKYSNNLPSNITSIKNFNCEENEKLNFLTYGTSSKNLYLILLEDL